MLKQGEVLATISGQAIPVTIDSGAEITIVPEKCVHDPEYTGEVATVDAYNHTKSVGKWCNVSITVGERQFVSKAVAQPGEKISWTGLLSFDLHDKEERAYLFNQIDLKEDLTEEEVHYMTPCVEDGMFKQAVMVSQGTVVAEDSTTHCETSGPQPQSEEVEVATVHASDTEESVGEVLEAEGVCEESVVEEQTTSLDLVEAEGVQQEDSADSRSEVELSMGNIYGREPRGKLGWQMTV